MTDADTPDTITVPARHPLPWILVGALASVVVLLGALLLASSAGAAEGETGTEATDADETDTNESAEVESDDGDECPGHHGKHHPHRMMHRDMGEASGFLAELIGIEPDALREALRSGQSLADVAAANDVDPQTLIDAIAARIQDRVDARLDAGLIDAEKAEQLRADALDNAERIVNLARTKHATVDGHRHKRTADGMVDGHGHRRGWRGPFAAGAAA